MRRGFVNSHRTLKNQGGWALPLVLMLMVVFTLLGTAAYHASQSSLMQAARLHPTLQCKYLARSAVDATKEAWSAKWLADPASVDEDESVTFYTRYDAASDEFVEESASNKDNDGVITTVQEYDTDTGICTITSTVSIGSHSAEVTAKSEKLSTTAVDPDADDPWFELRDYTSWLGLFDWSDWTLLPGPDDAVVPDAEGEEYSATYHTTEGVVVIEPEDHETLHANLSLSEYTVTGLQAKRIEFNCPVDLYWNTSVVVPLPNPHSLIVSAETIVFNYSLTIGDSSYGNLTLRLPPGAGMSGKMVYKKVAEANKDRDNDDKVDLDLIDQDKKYGLVKFSAVTINGSLIGNGQTNDPSQIANQAFFFRTMDEKALNIGTEPDTFSDLADMLGWTTTENDCRFSTLLANGYLIPAADDDIESYYDILFYYE